MRKRTVYLLSGAVLVALGFGLGHHSSTHQGAGGNPVSTKSLSAASVRARPVPQAAPPRGRAAAKTAQITPGPVASIPTPTATSSGDATLAVTGRAAGELGGVVVLRVPPSAPEECSPSGITLAVGQSAVALCRSANYGGPISASATDPAIALVRTSEGARLPRYFYVTGLKPGTTTISVSYPRGPTTQYRINVHPTSGA
jgi:hypothetical protein